MQPLLQQILRKSCKIIHAQTFQGFINDSFQVISITAIFAVAPLYQVH